MNNASHQHQRRKQPPSEFETGTITSEPDGWAANAVAADTSVAARTGRAIHAPISANMRLRRLPVMAALRYLPMALYGAPLGKISTKRSSTPGTEPQSQAVNPAIVVVLALE